MAAREDVEAVMIRYVPMGTQRRVGSRKTSLTFEMQDWPPQVVQPHPQSLKDPPSPQNVGKPMFSRC
nr:hypothetical protein CFP56_32323 [Quercus suber]